MGRRSGTAHQATARAMRSDHEGDNRRLLRARDAIDRRPADPLDVAALADIACMSPSHFIRSFRAAFGETPHRYLQRRRIQQAMLLLRTTDRSVSEICLATGWGSLGSFSRTFAEVVGVPPSTFRQGTPAIGDVPGCFVRRWTRPSSFGEAPATPAP